MFKCSFKIDDKVQKELNKTMWILSLINIIIGSIIFAIYIIAVILGAGSIFEDFIILGIFTLSFGVFMLIIVNKTNANSVKRNLLEELEINEDHVIEKISKDNEVVATNKFYYKDLMKIKETKNFLFLFINSSGAVPISKNAFSIEDFKKIKTMINNARYKK